MPTFLPFKTFYDRIGRSFGLSESQLYREDHSLEMEHFVQRAVAATGGDAQAVTTLLSTYLYDRAAYLSGRPYYKLWPEFIDPFCRTTLDVPVKYFRMPYAGWEIRLPQAEDGWMHPLAGYRIGVSYASTLADAAPAARSAVELEFVQRGLRDLKMEGLPMPLSLLLVLSHPKSADTPCDANGRGWMTFCSSIPMLPDKTVEESLETAFMAFKVKSDVIEVERVCMRLVLTLSFLITGSDKLIEPDVLSVDLQKFIEAKKAEDIERLHNKATRRRGEGIGYTVGRRERLLAIARQRNSEHEAGTGSPLKFQHQRAAHVHTYHTKAGVSMRWIPQLTVRPDLPPGDPGDGRGSQVR